MSDETPIAPLEKLSDQDCFALEKAKMNKSLAETELKASQLQNTAADLQFKNVVLQLYMKYGMSQNDAFDEQGNIHRNVKMEK